MLQSYLCDYSDAFIIVKGTITVTGDNNRERKIGRKKNNSPFINCISKVNNVLIDNAEGLYILMSMYNLFEQSKKYKKMTGSLWNYYEPSKPPVDNYNADPIANSVPFEDKISLIRKLLNNDNTKKRH